MAGAALGQTRYGVSAPEKMEGEAGDGVMSDERGESTEDRGPKRKGGNGEPGKRGKERGVTDDRGRMTHDGGQKWKEDTGRR